jgi:hypothetical protein
MKTYHQGDINFVPLEAFNKSASDVSRASVLRTTDQRLLIQEGEITGHHHGIWFMPRPVYLRDDAMAHALADQAETVITARLYSDDKLVAALKLDPGAPVVGFLVAETDVTIRHASEGGTPTNEHADIKLPAGGYLVTGKREWTAGDERRVQD